MYPRRLRTENTVLPLPTRRTALALSFVLLVASELIVARQGLGYMIGWLGDGGAYDAMFAVVLTVSLLGFAADRFYLMLVRRVLAWRE